jgi:cytochrome c553
MAGAVIAEQRRQPLGEPNRGAMLGLRLAGLLGALSLTPLVGFSQPGGADAAPVPQTPLTWAYPLNTPGVAALPDSGEPLSVPGSDRTFTRSEVRNLYRPPDWHPGDHPEMPEIVAQGREPGVYACGFCHLPSGQGRPENASLAGLPVPYIVQQMADYRSGLRRSSEPQMGPPAAMLAIGLNATESEVESAAAYFSSLDRGKWIRVVETDVVPETQVMGWMYVARPGGGTEPIGRRILEMPEDLERTELRDSRSGFVAYVPPGSLARGAALVATGADDRSVPCGTCHGTDLRGLGPVPPLAGRSPSYIARQLYDFKLGNRNGSWAPLMREAVAQLTLDDMLAIAAYAASLDP